MKQRSQRHLPLEIRSASKNWKKTLSGDGKLKGAENRSQLKPFQGEVFGIRPVNDRKSLINRAIYQQWGEWAV